MAGIQPKTDALSAVRSLAELAANQRGASLADVGLRLFDAPSGAVDEGHASKAEGDGPISPFALGRTYELLLAPDVRRKAGAHLTPEGVARGLVELMGPPQPGDLVLDPAVGGAAFLLAAADQLVAAGADPIAVTHQLAGVDLDAGAVAVAEAALALWALDNGVDPRPLPALTVGDGLLVDLPVVDRVVGNPPFLNQLRSSSTHTAERRQLLRERWGDLVGAYTDDAWLFLAAGLQTLRPGGVVAMVQPVSILAARHAHAVREHIAEQGDLDALWVGREQVFDAAVQVCGVVARAEQNRGTLRRAVGAGFEPFPPVAGRVGATEWGSAAAATIGVPELALVESGATLADMASATAGFRDQFYGFVPFTSDADAPTGTTGADDVDGLGDDRGALVTVGMIEPLQLDWGKRSFKFAGQTFTRPVVDLETLAAQDPSLARWVEERRRPKVLMATQTKVVEVWVDAGGTTIPATPVLSIEPHEADEEITWMIAAALTSPTMTAHFLATRFGTSLSLGTMKLSARDVLTAPLPANRKPWVSAAKLLRAEPGFLLDGSPEALGTFATLMGKAYDTPSDELVRWWADRLEAKRKRRKQS